MKEMDYKILTFIEQYKCISPKMASRMFYTGDYARDKAVKKLRLMEQNKILKSYINSLTKEKIYYVEDKLSAHDLYILDFYSLLLFHGCTEIKIELGPHLMNDTIRPDAFIEFVYEGYVYYILLEIDLTHFSGPKLPLYLKLKREEWLKDKCSIFPQIIIVGASTIKKHFEGLDILYMPFSLDGFEKVFVDTN